MFPLHDAPSLQSRWATVGSLGTGHPLAAARPRLVRPNRQPPPNAHCPLLPSSSEGSL